MSSTITLVCCAIALTLLAWASWTDLVSRSIPNRISNALVVLFIAFLVASDHLNVSRTIVSLGEHAMTAVVVLAIGFALWSRGVLGGGDVKLVSATALWAGPAAVFPMLMIVAICGGVIASIQIALAKFTAHSAPQQLALASDEPAETGDGNQTPSDVRINQISVPYGVAIAIGGAWVIARHL